MKKNGVNEKNTVKVTNREPKQEKWTEIFKGVIPPDSYRMQVVQEVAGDVTVYLTGWQHRAEIKFAEVAAMRTLDRWCYHSDDEQQFGRYDFANTIYLIENSALAEYMDQCMGTGEFNSFFFRVYAVCVYSGDTNRHRKLEIISSLTPTVIVYPLNKSEQEREIYQDEKIVVQTVEPTEEKWIKVFDGAIPNDNYLISLFGGEEHGVLIKLAGVKYDVEIDFGSPEAHAVRMLEPDALGCLDPAADEMCRKDGLANTIYEVIDGDWGNEYKRLLDGMLEIYPPVHQYVLSTENYRTDIMSTNEPKIKVSLYEGWDGEEPIDMAALRKANMIEAMEKEKLEKEK